MPTEINQSSVIAASRRHEHLMPLDDRRLREPVQIVVRVGECDAAHDGDADRRAVHDGLKLRLILSRHADQPQNLAIQQLEVRISRPAIIADDVSGFRPPEHEHERASNERRPVQIPGPLRLFSVP